MKILKKTVDPGEDLPLLKTNENADLQADLNHLRVKIPKGRNEAKLQSEKISQSRGVHHRRKKENGNIKTILRKKTRTRLVRNPGLGKAVAHPVSVTLPRVVIPNDTVKS